MPIGRLFRWIDRQTGDNKLGNWLGSIGNQIGSSANAGRRNAAGGSFFPNLPPHINPLSPTPPNPTIPNAPFTVSPTQPSDRDYFNQSGAVVGGLAGGALGAPLGPAAAAAGAAIGSQVGEALGAQIPVPGQTSVPAVSDPARALAMVGTGRQSRRAVAEYLLQSGALNGIIRQPVMYQAANGRVRYGSDLGNVLIRRMNGGRQLVFQMPKEIARALGWWRPRKKPIVSVRDSNAIRRSAAAKRRLERIAKRSGLHVTKNPRRRAPARRTGTRK